LRWGALLTETAANRRTIFRPSRMRAGWLQRERPAPSARAFLFRCNPPFQNRR